MQEVNGNANPTRRFSFVTDAISATVHHDRLKTSYEIACEGSNKFIRYPAAPYVTAGIELRTGDLQPDSNKKLVSIDPGLDDLISCYGCKVDRDELPSLGYTIRANTESIFSVSSRSQRFDRHSKKFYRKTQKAARKERVNFDPYLLKEEQVGEHAGRMSVRDLDKWFYLVTNNERREILPVVEGEEAQPDTILRVNKGTKTVIEDEWLEVVEAKLLHIIAIRKFKEKKIHRIQSLLRFSAKQVCLCHSFYIMHYLYIYSNIYCMYPYNTYIHIINNEYIVEGRGGHIPSL